MNERCARCGETVIAMPTPGLCIECHNDDQDARQRGEHEVSEKLRGWAPYVAAEAHRKERDQVVAYLTTFTHPEGYFWAKLFAADIAAGKHWGGE